MAVVVLEVGDNRRVTIHLIRREKRARGEGRKARKCPFPALFMRLEINIKNNVCVGYGLKMIR